MRCAFGRYGLLALLCSSATISVPLLLFDLHCKLPRVVDALYLLLLGFLARSFVDLRLAVVLPTLLKTHPLSQVYHDAIVSSSCFAFA
jgi:hypothetical protein